MKRTHFITKVLEDKFGGEWKKIDWGTRWRWVSDQHDFFVYATTEHKNGEHKQAYRRFDTKEIVFRSGGYRFYRPDGE